MNVQSKYLEDVIDAMSGHEGDEVGMRVRRHLVLQNAPPLVKSARSSILSARESSPMIVTTKSPSNISREELDSLPVFHILDTVVDLSDDPVQDFIADDNADGKYDEFTVTIDKIDGELKIHIRHDDDGIQHGLFIHGFRSGNPSAEQQLKLGDKILSLNGNAVEYLPELIALVQNDHRDTVDLSIRRFKHQTELSAEAPSGLFNSENLIEHHQLSFETVLNSTPGVLEESAAIQDIDTDEKSMSDVNLAVDRRDINQSSEEDDPLQDVDDGSNLIFGTGLLDDDDILVQSAEDLEVGDDGEREVQLEHASTPASTPRSVTSEVYVEHSFFLQKTNGALMLLIRYDDFLDSFDEDDDFVGTQESPRSEKKKKGGLFIHGFRYGSRAEMQGLIRIGDELLELNSVDIEGKELNEIAGALSQPPQFVDTNDVDSVWMKIRRQRIS